MFETATRKKFRFTTPQGHILTEDLWDIPLTASASRANLDDIARSLNKALKESETESFVVKSTKADEETQVKFEIVKHVIAVRLAEAEAAEAAQANRLKKQQILAIIAQKENEHLAGSSLDELKAMVDSL